jgi:hypothetical protein
MMSIFRRRVTIAAFEDEAGQGIRAALEDDFHHFRVSLWHKSGILQDIQGEGLRIPYSACQEAKEPLRQLIGKPLSPIAHSVNRQTDAQHQCTHLLDLAGLAIAAAARRTVRRDYEIEVPQRVAGQTHARLYRDGVLYMEWHVRDSVIASPVPYAGVNLREGMARWVFGHLDEEQAEAALLFRRCVLISLGRTNNLDVQIHASSTGRCYSQQPSRAATALRNKGSTLDFSNRPEALGADDLIWVQG